MSEHALVVGKFYPPHVGHHKLIDTALAECPKVTVAVCYSSVENISVYDRIDWLRDRHPDAYFVAVKDDTPVMYTDETWGWFLDALTYMLYAHNRIPDVVYSGEDYAPEFARRLLARYKADIADGQKLTDYPPPSVDYRILDRSELICRATDFRNDPITRWRTLAPATRAGMCKRIVICGAESSGTTTLAKALGDYYKTTVVPEYGRHFDWAVGKHHVWTAEDFFHIQKKQREWEFELARTSEGGVLICDTDEYATAMFSEVYLGEEETSGIIQGIASQTPADLYIITNDAGIDFEDDGTRFNSGRRPWMTQWFATNLPNDVPVTLVSGPPSLRLVQAIEAVNRVLVWDIATPIEYRQTADAA